MIRLIVALDSKGGIAKNGMLPWRLPTDQQYFKEQTMRFGGVILMGRITFDTIGHPLPGRQNYVLSHDTFQAEGITAVHDVHEFMKTQPEVWAIGGAKVYAETLPYADELYLTHIDRDYQCDLFFPEVPAEKFAMVSKSLPQHHGDTTFVYEILKRV
ncbi:MAG: dihydrofolate reductase [Candidatus Saccharibacteria bacterium]|nr:dihydrofolate reductase [Candidatus Saccharibacteria bacterium]